MDTRQPWAQLLLTRWISEFQSLCTCNNLLPRLMNRSVTLAASEKGICPRRWACCSPSQATTNANWLYSKERQRTFLLSFEQISGQENAHCQMTILMPLLRHWLCLLKPNFTQILLAYQERALLKSGQIPADQSQVIPLERIFVS